MNKDRRVSLLLIIGIVVFIFLLSRQFFFRIDLTEDKEFTMSKATKNILRDLEDPVDVKAYFTSKMPAEFERIKIDFQNLLVEYNNISKGKINYRFIDPSKDPTFEQEAMQNGIQPALINMREKDEASQKKVFMGAVVEYGDQKEILPFIGQESAMEYELTTAIKKISVKDKPAIAFITGHGEPDFGKMPHVMQNLSVIYTVENLDLAKEETIPSRYQTVVWVNPVDSVPPDQYNKVANYLMQGGKVIMAVNGVNADLSQASGSPNTHSVLQWLASLGVTIDPTFVIDQSCGRVGVQNPAFFNMTTQIMFPYFPLVNQFPDHPATKGLEAVLFQFVSPVKFSASASGSFIPIVTSSDKAGTLQAPVYFDVNKQWQQSDFPLSHVVLGGVVEGINNNAESKLVVFGDADFLLSDQRQVIQDNVSLAVNTVEWLSDKTGLAELRTKGVVYRPIKELEEGERTFTKYFNFLLPLALVAAVGIWRTQRNRNIRMRRMSEKYS